MPEFEGVHAAALTPRDPQGDLDLGAAFEMLDFLGKAGVAGIALFTTTGEYAALAPDERSRLAYLARKRSRVPILIGVGSATLEHSLTLAREARDSGAAALLAPPPFFFSYQQDDIREFYLQLAKRLGRGIDIFLSHYPGPTTAMSPETVNCLLETGLFAGIEDAGSDAAGAAAVRAAVNARGMSYLGAHDWLLTEARLDGATGAVSAAACAVPELVVALDRSIRAGKSLEIERLDTALREFLSWSNRFPEPVVVKVAAGLRGLKTGPLSTPLPLAKQKDLEGFREWFQGWLPGVKKISANA